MKAIRSRVEFHREQDHSGQKDRAEGESTDHEILARRAAPWRYPHPIFCSIPHVRYSSSLDRTILFAECRTISLCRGKAVQKRDPSEDAIYSGGVAIDFGSCHLLFCTDLRQTGGKDAIADHRIHDRRRTARTRTGRRLRRRHASSRCHGGARHGFGRLRATRSERGSPPDSGEPPGDRTSSRRRPKKKKRREPARKAATPAT